MFNIALDKLLNVFIRIAAVLRSDLIDLSLQLRPEMYFHAARIWRLDQLVSNYLCVFVVLRPFAGDLIPIHLRPPRLEKTHDCRMDSQGRTGSLCMASRTAIIKLPCS